MPLIPEFVSALDEIKSLHKKKNDDYAFDANPFFNFDVQRYFIDLVKDSSDKVFFSLIGLKVARLANLLNSNIQPSNESILDSFNDLASYALLHKAAYMRRTEIKRLSTAQIEKANTV